MPEKRSTTTSTMRRAWQHVFLLVVRNPTWIVQHSFALAVRCCAIANRAGSRLRDRKTSAWQPIMRPVWLLVYWTAARVGTSLLRRLKVL